MPEPWFKMYSTEFLLDARVNSLTLQEQAILVRMWCVCHQIESIPTDPSVVAKMIGVNLKTLRSCWDHVRIMFTSSTDDDLLMHSSRLDDERIKSAWKSDRHRIGANKTNEKRWNKVGVEVSLSDRSKDEDEDEDRDKGLPPNPLKGESIRVKGKAHGKGRAPKKTDKLSLDFTPEIAALANEIMDACPKAQPEGGKIRVDPGSLAQRLEGILRGGNEDVTPDLLSTAWKSYVASSPKAYKAPQYFFGEQKDQGSNGANWIPWARMAYRKEHPKAEAVTP